MTLNEIERAELAQHEEVIQRGIGTFVEVGEALLAIRDQRLFRSDFDTFEDYCRERWGFNSPHARRLIRAAETVGNIKNDPMGSFLPTGERQIRPLTALPPDQQREVWQRAVETAPDGKVTAGHVQRVVDEMTRPQSDDADDEDWDIPLRFQDGMRAYCKYCYTTHTNWEMPGDYGTWRCGECGHNTSDEMMQIGGPETQWFDTEIQQWHREDYKESEEDEPEPEPARLAVHFSSETPEHYTPREIIDAATECMDAIDLDPCSNSHDDPNVPAALHYTKEDDGLVRSWHGRVYMNPPYGREIMTWVQKLCGEYEAGHTTEAIALVPARTDTQWWQLLRDYPVCFIQGRLKFGGLEDSAPFPSAVFYLGNNIDRFYYAFLNLGDVWQRIEPGMFGE
jgi:hypothetical protein